MEFHWLPRYDWTKGQKLNILEKPLTTQDLDRGRDTSRYPILDLENLEVPKLLKTGFMKRY
jgi:hypothetical protein